MACLMKMVLRFFCLLLTALGSGFAACAQPESPPLSWEVPPLADTFAIPLDTAAPHSRTILVRNILITGNRRTNPDIILRELNFEVGEPYEEAFLMRKFNSARKQLMNTNLFYDVVVSMESLSDEAADVKIEVREKWYLWPKPFVRMVDRTFHQWWREQNRSMDRINYGIKLSHNNFTGRNDKLRINFTNGYTRQLSLQYHGLFLDNELKWSVSGGFSMGRNHEVNYMTKGNKLVGVKDEGRYLRSFMSWFGEVAYRPAIKTRHSITVSYGQEDFADTVFKLNPHFTNSHGVFRVPDIAYRMTYLDVDFAAYPTRGVMGDVLLRRRGFNDPINLWQLTAKGARIWPLKKNYFFTASAVGIVKLPLKQPYVTNGFIGYDEQYLQGYEYYVIDGVAGGYVKATLARPVLDTRLRIRSQRFKSLNNLPIKIYAKTYVNAGIVHCQRPGFNELNNTWLYSGGIGFDIVALNDFVIKIEWSVNRLGENGLYLHRRNYF